MPYLTSGAAPIVVFIKIRASINNSLSYALDDRSLPDIAFSNPVGEREVSLL
jgi:hypothetical protein